MKYRIDYDTGVLRSLQRFPRDIQRRVLVRLELLENDPRPPGSIKLAGRDAYRVRVGDYRIVYTIHDAILLILVIDVGHRGDVYRRR
jgi:mRNA interferase RelE/StbE